MNDDYYYPSWGHGVYYGGRPFYPPAYVYRPVYGGAYRPAVGYASPAGYRNNYNNVRVNNVNINVNNNNNYYNRFNNNQNLRTGGAHEVPLRTRRTEHNRAPGTRRRQAPREIGKGNRPTGARRLEIRLRRPVRTPALSPPIARQQGQLTLHNVPIVATTAHHARRRRTARLTPPHRGRRRRRGRTARLTRPPHRGRRRRRRLNKRRRATARSPAPKLPAAATFNTPPVLVVTPAWVHARFPEQARGNVRQIRTERKT